MFTSEEKMRNPVTRWMRSLGLFVKTEFITPWGICDLVGARPRKRSVSQRLKLGQTNHVSSLTRAALLLDIPDVGTNESASFGGLIRTFSPIIPEETIIGETKKLLADGFVVSNSKDRFQRLNGWAPLHRQLIAVELKLSRVEEAMWQARSNLSFADESYVALPSDLALRVAAKPERWAEFFDFGVGLIGVSSRSCTVITRSRHQISTPDPVLQFYCIEKFWRAFSIDN